MSEGLGGFIGFAGLIEDAASLAIDCSAVAEDEIGISRWKSPLGENTREEVGGGGEMG